MKTQLLAVLAIGLLIGAGVTQGDDQAEAKKVLDKAMKAMGGKEKLAKLSTVSMKGTILFKDQQQEATIHFDGIGQGTSKYRIDVQIEEGGNQKGAGTLVLNGNKGWLKEPDKSKDAPAEFVQFFQDL